LTLSKVWSRHNESRRTAIVSSDESLTRYIFERRYVKDGRAKQGAFLPELYKQRLETSVCRISNINETRIWHLGRTARPTKQLHARADFPVVVAYSQKLDCVPVPEVNFPEHAVLIGWPEAAEEKMRQKAIAAELASVAVVSLLPT
jgi:hypothetical protein